MPRRKKSYEVGYTSEMNGALALGLGMMGQFDQALSVIDEKISHLEHGDMFMPELHRIRGELLEKIAEGARAEEAYLRSLELADSQFALSWRLRTVTCLARLYARQARRTEARHLLGETFERFSEGFDTADLKTAKSLLTDLA